MFLYRFTELSVEPEKPHFLWDADSLGYAQRRPISCGGYRVHRGAPYSVVFSGTLCLKLYMDDDTPKRLWCITINQPLQHGFFRLDKHRIVPRQPSCRVVKRRARHEGVELVAEVFVVDDFDQPRFAQRAQCAFRHLHGVAL